MYKKIYDQIYQTTIIYIDADSDTEFKEILKKEFNIEITDASSEDAAACYANIDQEGRVFIWAPITSPSKVAHECIHAATYVFNHVGVPISRDNDEALAYYVQFIMRNIYEEEE